MKMRRGFRVIINSIMAAVVAAAWLHMFYAGGGLLSSEGFSSMRFYTVLSNQLEGIASIIWLISFLKVKGKGAIPAWVEALKYVACVSVFLTFTIVIAFLGPLYGHENMYNGANLWFHLIIPVIAVIEMVFLSERAVTKRDNRVALYPTVLYGIVYMGNNVINGIGQWPDTNDWYGFLLWGYPAGILIFIGIGVVTWALGRLVKTANNRFLLRNRETGF